MAKKGWKLAKRKKKPDEKALVFVVFWVTLAVIIAIIVEIICALTGRT